ncbi:MAG TPA: 50S ribosomal protein L21 [Bdellovibrionales bacterium]|nr:50S ribosomal protein L21 [Bdellovibrionales bacterium]
MYAIIKAGGKQYTVKPGDVLRVEKLEAELGAELNLKDVLMVGGDKTFVGGDVAKASVTVVVTNQERGPKLVVFKKKRRQGYRRMGGHRQPYTELFVKSITNPDGQTAKADGKPQVFNPEKKAQALAKTNEVREAWKQKNRAAQAKGEAPVQKKAKAAKAPAKKAAAKKSGAKKSGAKKATAKKAAKSKKTTKK